MNFLEAVKEMKQGKKVSRNDKRLFNLESHGEIIQVVTSDNKRIANIRSKIIWMFQ